MRQLKAGLSQCRFLIGILGLKEEGLLASHWTNV